MVASFLVASADTRRGFSVGRIEASGPSRVLPELFARQSSGLEDSVRRSLPAGTRVSALATEELIIGGVQVLRTVVDVDPPKSPAEAHQVFYMVEAGESSYALGFGFRAADAASTDAFAASIESSLRTSSSDAPSSSTRYLSLAVALVAMVGAALWVYRRQRLRLRPS